MDTTTIPADRLRQQLEHMHIVGYELGEHLGEHIDIADLLTLPTEPDATARLVACPFEADFLSVIADPDDDWCTWETELLPASGVHGPIAHNQVFWAQLYQAIESHVLAGADEVEINQDGTVDVIADRLTGCCYRRPAPSADQAPGVVHIGRLYLATGGLPEPFSAGIAAALHDLRSAVLVGPSAVTG